MGAGLDMAPGDIAFKSNFATLNPTTGIVEHRRADRNFEALGPPLCAALDGLKLPSFPDHQVAVRYATEHRCGVVVRGAGLTDAVSGARFSGAACASGRGVERHQEVLLLPSCATDPTASTSADCLLTALLQPPTTSNPLKAPTH